VQALSNRNPHHFFITRMLDISVPVEQVNCRFGHKPVAMTNRTTMRTKNDMGRL